MNEFDPHNYTITVKRVLEDGEPLFKATVKELPHVTEYGDAYDEVYELAIDAINTLREMASDMGHRFPGPSEEDDRFSGRVTLRMPKSLHRDIANTADLEGVSLNQLLVTTIAEKVGGSQMYAVAAEYFSRQLIPSVRSYQIGSIGSIGSQVILQHGAETQPENVIIGSLESASTEDSEIVPRLPGFLNWEQRRNG